MFIEKNSETPNIISFKVYEYTGNKKIFLGWVTYFKIDCLYRCTISGSSGTHEKAKELVDSYFFEQEFLE